MVARIRSSPPSPSAASWPVAREAVADGYTTEFVNVNTAGQKADITRSRFPSVNVTVGIMAFDSDGTNLVSGDTNGLRDVFVRYRGIPMTVRASVSTSGTQANGASGRPALSYFAERVASSPPRPTSWPVTPTVSLTSSSATCTARRALTG
jgi:hypothetical protein